MPVLAPKPPVGGNLWAASPARKTRPCRKVSATSAVRVPECEVDQLHLEVVDADRAPGDLEASLGCEAFRALTARGVKRAQDKPAIGAMGPQQRAVAARRDVADGGPVANPGGELGAEVDVDVVVNLTGAEHRDTERLAGVARGAVGCDQPGGARGKSSPVSRLRKVVATLDASCTNAVLKRRSICG